MEQNEKTLKERTVKGLIWSGLGTFAREIAALVFGVFLARILSVEDYGTVGMLQLFVVVANSLIDSGFVSALINLKNPQHEDYNAVFWFSIFTGALLYIILFLSAGAIADFYNYPELKTLARVQFIYFFILGFTSSHRAYLYKNLKNKEASLAMLWGVLFSGFIGVIMAKCGMGYWALVAQNLGYALFFTIAVWLYSPWRCTLKIDFSPLKKMFGFGVKLMITNIFNSINEQIFTVLLGRFFKKSDVGQYSQANKWMTMGQVLVTGFVSQIAQPVFVEAGDEKSRLLNVFNRMISLAAMLSFPALFGLAFVAPEFIEITIKSKWLQCVPVLRILCIWGAFAPINFLFYTLLIGRGKSNIYMWVTVAKGAFQLVVLLFTYHFGIIFMAYFYVVLNILWIGVYHFFVKKEIDITILSMIKNCFPYFAAVSAGLICAYFASVCINNIYFGIIVKIAVTSVVYFLILRLLNDKMLYEGIDIFKKKTGLFTGKK